MSGSSPRSPEVGRWSIWLAALLVATSLSSCARLGRTGGLTSARREAHQPAIPPKPAVYAPILASCRDFRTGEVGVCVTWWGPDARAMSATAVELRRQLEAACLALGHEIAACEQAGAAFDTRRGAEGKEGEAWPSRSTDF